jgi:putative intracellular protease/amidase
MATLVLAICTGTLLLLAAGPAAGENLERAPGPGLLAALVGGIVGLIGATGASRSSSGAS